MPAVNPAQLRIKAASLAEKVDQPRQFVRDVHDLLSFYANRVHQAGESGAPPPAIDSYHVSPQVLRIMERELKGVIEDHPAEGLLLVDQLWEEEWLETRLLACGLLSHAGTQRSDEILARVQSWMWECQDDILLKAVLDRALSPIRSHEVEAYYSLLDDLHGQQGEDNQRILLHLLLPLVDEPSFQDLPAVFKYLKPILQSESEDMLSDLSRLIRRLVRRSEQEAMFFLLHQIPTAPHPKITRAIRRSLPAFSPDSRERLKKAIREI